MSTSTQKHSRALFSSLFLVGCLAFDSYTARAQTSDRSEAAAAPTEVTFHLSYEPGGAPVKVTRIMLGDEEVPFDTPVPVSGMWLRKVNVVVQNVSPKPVIKGAVTLLFPETGKGNKEMPTLASTLALGQVPPHGFLRKDGSTNPRGAEGQEPEINVLPNTSMVFSFKGQDHSYADQDQIRGTQMAGQLTRIDIVLGRFFFSDESMWENGNFYAPVSAPTVWKKITPAEFFGTQPAMQ